MIATASNNKNSNPDTRYLDKPLLFPFYFFFFIVFSILFREYETADFIRIYTDSCAAVNACDNITIYCNFKAYEQNVQL